jgi:predicted PurR-regulated permease PerM
MSNLPSPEETAGRPRAEQPAEAAPAGDPGSAAAAAGPAAGEPAVSSVAFFRQRAFALGFGVLSLVLLVLLLLILRPVARPILWATALATLFYPLHERVLRLTRGRANLAAVISTVLSIAVFAVPATFFISSFLAEVRNLWPVVQSALGQHTFERLAILIDSSPLRPVIPWFFQSQPYVGAATIEGALRDLLSAFSNWTIVRLEDFGRSAPGQVASTVMTVITYYFLLRNGPGWVGQLKQALPLEREHAESLTRIAATTVNAVFRGVILTAAVQAVLAGIGFWLAGAPAAVVLGGITMVAALIPLVGPVAVWLPVAIGLMVSGRVGPGIGLFLWGALVVSMVDNFLRPFVIGRETKLPVLWLFLALLGGLKTFGFLGILLGPIVLALFLACIRIYSEGRRA